MVGEIAQVGLTGTYEHYRDNLDTTDLTTHVGSCCNIGITTCGIGDLTWKALKARGHEFVTKRLKLQLAMIKTLHVSQGIDPAKYSAPKTKWHPAMELAGAKEIPLNERAKDFDKFSLSTGGLQFLVHRRVAAEQQACELAGTTARPRAPPVPATMLGQVAPAGVPLAVSPAGAGLRRITLYQLSRLWANALAV
jgi:hypothetical protein